jgi:hypothetical protein
MRTIIIAQRDSQFADRLAAVLRDGGYRAVTCPGPWPPDLRCIRHDAGYCPLAEAADLLIYDPDLVARGEDQQEHRLVEESAEAEADVPVLLAWPSDDEPTSVRGILERVPRVGRAARAPRALVEQVFDLIGPPIGPSVTIRSAARPSR